jgi:hypothetical protein
MAKLPDVPQGKELEDYVAALLQCAGYFVEKNIIERGRVEVLELDMVATDYIDDLPKRLLFEVKSGNWGFSDIFKLLGWKTYMGPDKIDSAYFVATGLNTDKPIDFFKEKCEQLGIFLLAVYDHNQIEQALIDTAIISNRCNELDHALWRYSLWIERVMLNTVANSRRSDHGTKGPDEVYNYQELVKNGIALTGDVRERVAALYEAHFNHQWLAKAVAAELDGTVYNADSAPEIGEHWRKALYNGDYLLIQAALYYQHKARLGILKGAVDYACLERTGTLPKEKVIKFLGLEMPVHPLPPNFHKTVEVVQSIEHFEKIPALWQIFLWKWGGFFLVDQEIDERSKLADEAGMPLDAANRALELFGDLFPVEGGWFTEVQGTRIIKLFPIPFRGIGAVMRLHQADSESYNSFKSTKYLYLHVNLSRWNNSAAKLLGAG